MNKCSFLGAIEARQLTKIFRDRKGIQFPTTKKKRAN